MKKLLGFFLLLFLFSCEPQEVCKTCYTVTILIGKVEYITQEVVCGEDAINEKDGFYEIAYNPITEEFYIKSITTCK